jgi:hypothetical protein
VNALNPGHRAELHASGLSDATIARAGCYSATEAGVRALLGYGAGPALVFPYPELNGSGPYARVKFDRPDSNGRRYRADGPQQPALHPGAPRSGRARRPAHRALDR